MIESKLESSMTLDTRERKRDQHSSAQSPSFKSEQSW